MRDQRDHDAAPAGPEGSGTTPAAGPAAGAPDSAGAAPQTRPPGKRGRRPIGAPDTVRLPPDLREFVLGVGDGKLPEGVRIAVRAFKEMGEPLGLSEEDLAHARRLGNGSVAEGMRRLVRKDQRQRRQFPGKAGKGAEELLQLLGDLAEVAATLGGGDLGEGMRRALRVGRVLGPDTCRKLDDGPASTNP